MDVHDTSVRRYYFPAIIAVFVFSGHQMANVRSVRDPENRYTMLLLLPIYPLLRQRCGRSRCYGRDIDFELESSRQLSDFTVVMNNAAALSSAPVIYFIMKRYLRQTFNVYNRLKLCYKKIQ